jgi:alkanesulfonate monooxygenase SsuD/methylene tetrahydromethanopterin reductase-like flavin-dependent oxidoreductase (luciferase family)
MKVYYFSEFPYHEYAETEGAKYPSLRLTFPNTNYDSVKAHELFHRYLDEYQYCEEMGFDGLMINEHHNTPSCMNATMKLIGAILARNTKRAKILLLGNVLPIWDNPVRLAEEVAMLDILSNGRVISGFVRGVGVESMATNTNPVHNRERFEEAHDLVLKTWTTPGPFRWEGQHFHFRVVNPWIVPIQKPHPPIWVPGSASPETVRWAAQHGYTYAAFLTPLGMTKELFALYRSTAAEANREVGPENFAYLLCCYVADTDARAQQEAQHFIWRMGETTRGPREYFAPPGYRSRAGIQMAARRRTSEGIPLNKQSLEELQANYHIVAGTPDSVLKKLRFLKDELNMEHLIFYGQESRMSHEAAMRSIELFGKEVMPVVREW